MLFFPKPISKNVCGEGKYKICFKKYFDSPKTMFKKRTGIEPSQC
jgi:hypothetical protein